jgi:hypothetical protein
MKVVFAQLHNPDTAVFGNTCHQRSVAGKICELSAEKNQRKTFPAALLEMPGHHETIAAVITFSAEDQRTASLAQARMFLDCLNHSPAGGFHQHGARQTEDLNGLTVNLMHLSGC